MTFDPYQQSIVIKALNDMRNDMINEKRPTDSVDEVLLLAIDSPIKKVKCRDEGR